MPAPRNGLRRVWNPPNPYLTRENHSLGEPPVAEAEVYEDATRTILARNRSPDLGFEWSLNPYRGCFHACAYCYARPTHEHLGFGAGSDFERRLVVKPRAPELLEAAFRKRSWRGELVVFSGNTDCYQPLEATWNLTRKCLDVCRRFRNPVGIITKSSLIRRDVPLLAEMTREGIPLTVAVSLPFADEVVARKLEPGAPTIARRFETVRALADAGVSVGLAVAPIIPGLNDGDIPEILKRGRDAGARFAFRSLLRLPGSARDVFLRRLAEEFPDRAARVESRLRDVRGGELGENRFGRRMRGRGDYWRTIDRLWSLWARKTGLDDAWMPNDATATAAFRRPSAPGQMDLWPTLG